MNLFFLDAKPRIAATYLADKHVGKMLLEACQMMSTAARANGFEGGYKSAYENHPMTKWVGQSFAHYNWCWEHAIALAVEHVVRFETEHSAQDLLPTLSVAMHKVMPDLEWRNPPRCIPDKYKIEYDTWDDPAVPCHVQSYRDYYQHDKAHLHKWTNREAPIWIV